MSPQSLREENERLKAVVESYREREIAELRSALAATRKENDLLREDVNRNAEAGRKIHAIAQEEINSLRSQLQAAKTLDSYQHRFGAKQANGKNA